MTKWLDEEDFEEEVNGVKSVYRSSRFIEEPTSIPLDPEVNRKLYLANGKLCQFPGCSIELGNWPGQFKPNVDHYPDYPVRGYIIPRSGLVRGMVCGHHNEMMDRFDRGNHHDISAEDFDRCRSYYQSPPAFQYIGRYYYEGYGK